MTTTTDLIAAHEAAYNQERRYLRALTSDAYDALKIAKESKAFPRQVDTALDVAEKRILAVFNRLTDKIVAHEIMLDKSNGEG